MKSQDLHEPDQTHKEDLDLALPSGPPRSMLQGLAGQVGARALQRRMEERRRGAVVQRKPTDLRVGFAENKLAVPGSMAYFTDYKWYEYYHVIKAYCDLPDDRLDLQKAMFHRVYAEEKRLRAAHYGSFNENQKILANGAGKLCEMEKEALYKTEIGGLNTQDQVPHFMVPDQSLVPGDNKFKSEHDLKGAFKPLFSRLPTLDDVQQGGLGDCYLLSAVASILDRDPHHFVQHLRDHMDGTVTVRFYKLSGEPFHVTVEKSVVGDEYARGGLWVKLLEKAYVASGLKTKDVGQNKQRTFKDIEGGEADVAMTHLTGRQAQNLALGQGRNRFETHMSKQLLEAVSSLQVEMRKTLDSISAQEKLKREKLLKDEKADVSQEIKAIKELDEQFLVQSKEWKAIDGPNLELADMLKRLYVSQDMFDHFIKQHSDNPLLVKTAEQMQPKEGALLPGPLGSGRYGNDEQDAFLLIKQGIDGKRPMTAITKNSIADKDNPVEGTGLAGESKVGGLASRHAYSLLDYKPKEPKPGEIIMVRLRNPWGFYGRKYEETKEGWKGKAEEKGDGTFWIDLADLVAYFSNIAALG